MTIRDLIEKLEEFPEHYRIEIHTTVRYKIIEVRFAPEGETYSSTVTTVWICGEVK